jgi:hypothetical protein
VASTVKNQAMLFILIFTISIMGYDFYIQLKCFIKGRWITVVNLGAETRCGGFPLALVTPDLWKKTLIITSMILTRIITMNLN